MKGQIGFKGIEHNAAMKRKEPVLSAEDIPAVSYGNMKMSPHSTLLELGLALVQAA